MRSVRYADKREERVIITIGVSDKSCYIYANGVDIGHFDSNGKFVRNKLFSESCQAESGLEFGDDRKIVVE